MAKAAFWDSSDAEGRKRGEQTGIRYPGSPRPKRWMLGLWGIDPLRAKANAISIPPGDYGRKAKTQRN